MRVLLDDQKDGSQFPVDITKGEPRVGSLIVTSTKKDDLDRRIYLVTAIKGDVLTVERQTISIGVYA